MSKTAKAVKDTGEDKVLSYVRAALKRNPERTNESLYEQAKKLDPAIAKLDLRQFHARYPLHVKRALNREKRAESVATPTAAEAEGIGTIPQPLRPRTNGRRVTPEYRQRVRATLMDFAGKIAEAESRADIIAVIGDVDTYVDRLVSKAEN